MKYFFVFQVNSMNNEYIKTYYAIYISNKINSYFLFVVLETCIQVPGYLCQYQLGMGKISTLFLQIGHFL
jgi:hypothetical protein